MSVWTIAEQRGHIVHEGTDEWSLGAMERVIIAGRAIWFYAGKVLWPVRLTFVYPRWDVNVRSFSSWLPFLGLAAVGLFLYLCRRKPWARAGVFALGFYLAALLPVLGFLDIYYFRYSFVADHFQYLASLGVIAGVTGGIAAMVARHTHRLQATGRAASVVLLGMVTCLSWKQERIYWSDEALWRDTLMKNPGAWMAQNNLGNDLWATGRSQEAIDCYEQALRINARDLEAYDNLGIAMGQAGKYDDAVKNFQRALQIRPDLAQVQYNLGMALVGLGRMPEAIEHWKEAVRLEPDYIEAYYNLGVAQERAGKREEAIAQYQQALRIDPNYSPAQNALAKLQAAP
jgi:tetratricopeptide (TPR) repeat protein